MEKTTPVIDLKTLFAQYEAKASQLLTLTNELQAAKEALENAIVANAEARARLKRSEDDYARSFHLVRSIIDENMDANAMLTEIKKITGFWDNQDRPGLLTYGRAKLQREGYEEVKNGVFRLPQGNKRPHDPVNEQEDDPHKKQKTTG